MSWWWPLTVAMACGFSCRSPWMSIVLEYHLGLLDGALVAAEIKKVKPQVPIVMLADHMELPESGLESMDALVTKADGDRFLLETIDFVLNVKPAQRIEKGLKAQAPIRFQPPGETGNIQARRS